MSSTNKTPNYNLDQYIGTDKPTYLVDYNGDMLKIDTAIHSAATSADSAVATANSAVEQVGAIGTKAQNALDTANTANTTANNAVVIANNTTKIAGDAQVDAHAALTQSNTAIETANKASADVGTILPQVTEAVNTANTASQSVLNIKDFSTLTLNVTPASATSDPRNYCYLISNKDKSLAIIKGLVVVTEPKLLVKNNIPGSASNLYDFMSADDPNNVLNLKDEKLYYLGTFTHSVVIGGQTTFSYVSIDFYRRNNKIILSCYQNTSNVSQINICLNGIIMQTGIGLETPNTDFQLSNNVYSF